jgi:V/A-type H+-transporting ATPase subunit E
MAETIESFVAKLQAEGVEAGRQAAEKLLAEARQQAEQIVQDAKEQAEKHLTDAKADGEKLLTRSRTELELAARDVVLRLRSALGRALEAIVAAEVKKELPDSDFVSRTLHDLVLMYAAADIEHRQTMSINVSPELRGQLTDWALEMMHKHARETGMTIDLQGTLEAAGFEYTLSGATVEVTLRSVTESICELVGARLREIIDKAVGDLQSGEERKDCPDPEPTAAGESK